MFYISLHLPLTSLEKKLQRSFCPAEEGALLSTFFGSRLPKAKLYLLTGDMIEATEADKLGQSVPSVI